MANIIVEQSAAQAAITKQLNDSVKISRLQYLETLRKQRAELAAIFKQARAEVAISLSNAGSFESRVSQTALLADIDKTLTGLTNKEFEYTKMAIAEAAFVGQTAAASLLKSELGSALGLSIKDFPLARSNIRAANALLAADYSVLSKTIWSHKEASLQGIKKALSVGVAQGKSVSEISKHVMGYLSDTEKSNARFQKYQASYRSLIQKARENENLATQLRQEAANRVQSGKSGNALLRRAGDIERKSIALRSSARRALQFARASKVARDGMYVSMEANTWRMVRHMTNLGYREGYLAGAKRYSDFVYQQWTLSTGHRCCDICDEFANYDNGLGPGVYKVENYPGVPHVGCLCYPVPVVNWNNITLGA